MDSSARGRVVEKLALLDEVSAAKSLAADTAQPTKAVMLGKFGAGRARAGSTEDARWAANEINSLSDTSASMSLADVSARAIVEISLELSAAGALEEAVNMAAPLPNRVPKVQALSRSAQILCKKDISGAGYRLYSQTVLQQVVNAGRLAVEAADKPFEKVNGVATVGEAIASCGGADKAKTYIVEATEAGLVDRTLATLVDRLAQQGEFILGHLLLPAADPEDAGNLLDTARRLIKLNDRSRATAVATQAARVALKIAGASTSKPGGYYEYIGQLSQIYGVLIELGSYDDAIAIVQPIDANNRLQYYANTVKAAIRRSDAAGVARLLPIAIEAFKMDSTPDHFIQFNSLFELTRTLAVAGYRDEAQKTFFELQGLAGKPGPTDKSPRVALLAAILLADRGDLRGPSRRPIKRGR
jgi:tetratricopeptide (TPR) repeat protein